MDILVVLRSEYSQFIDDTVCFFWCHFPDIGCHHAYLATEHVRFLFLLTLCCGLIAGFRKQKLFCYCGWVVLIDGEIFAFVFSSGFPKFRQFRMAAATGSLLPAWRGRSVVVDRLSPYLQKKTAVLSSCLYFGPIWPGVYKIDIRSLFFF